MEAIPGLRLEGVRLPMLAITAARVSAAISSGLSVVTNSFPGFPVCDNKYICLPVLRSITSLFECRPFDLGDCDLEMVSVSVRL